MQNAETVKVAPSARKAQPVPGRRHDDGADQRADHDHRQRTDRVSRCEFASTSCSSGTIIGTIELNAGQKIAWPAP